MRDFFSLGTRSDHVVLFSPAEQAQLIPVEEALITSYRVYQPLFGNQSGVSSAIPFQIVIWLTGTPSSSFKKDKPVQADAGFESADTLGVAKDIRAILDDDVCVVRVFNEFKSSVDQRATIAHEFAHCYQNYYNRASFAAASDPMSQWWIEGGAEWLAALVYPAEFPNSLSALFRYNTDVLANAYDDIYFWKFLESADGLGSAQAAVDFMIGVAEDSTTHGQYLENMKSGENSTEVFHKWMLALVQGRIPFQPKVDLPGFTLKSAVSGSVNLNTPRYSGDRAKIIDVKVDKGNQATVTAINLTANNYAVSLMIGGTPIRLSDSVSAKFCPPAGGLELLISRGYADKGDKTDFTLTFGQTPSTTPCESAKPAEASSGSCIVGDWVVVSVPQAVANADMTMVSSDYKFKFQADGSLSGDYNIEVENGATHVSTNVPFSGSYQVIPLNDGEHFEVSAWTWVYSTSGTVVAKAAGQSRDISGVAIKGLNDNAASNAPTKMTCTDDHLTWVTRSGETVELDRVLVP